LEISAKDRETLREYLLGQQAGTDLPQVEERLMTDSTLYEELLILEDELVDQYVRGSLSAEERASFERYFLGSPERQQKLRFSRAFSKYLDIAGAVEPTTTSAYPTKRSATQGERTPSKLRGFSFLPFQKPVVTYALAAALTIVVLSVTWVVWRNLRQVEPGRTLAVALTPGLTRGDEGQVQKIVLSPDIGTLQLQLLLPQVQYNSYEAVLLAYDGRALTTRKNLTAVDGSVFLAVPATLLATGDFRVKLSGLDTAGHSESAASYLFRIQMP
jgi:hypothetical protein